MHVNEDGWVVPCTKTFVLDIQVTVPDDKMMPKPLDVEFDAANAIFDDLHSHYPNATVDIKAAARKDEA